jgi:hypothetical protein
MAKKKKTSKKTVCIETDETEICPDCGGELRQAMIPVDKHNLEEGWECTEKGCGYERIGD